MSREKLAFYGIEPDMARFNAIIDGLLEPKDPLKDIEVISEESGGSDVIGSWYPPIKGLSEEENLRLHSDLIIRQIVENDILSKILL